MRTAGVIQSSDRTISQQLSDMVAEECGCSTAVIEMADFLRRVGEQPWESGIYCRWRMGVPVVVVQRGASSPALSRRRILRPMTRRKHFPKTKSCSVQWSKFSTFLCLEVPRPFPRTESSSGPWSRSLTFHSRRLWRSRQSFSRFSLKTGFNCLRRSLSYPSFRRK